MLSDLKGKVKPVVYNYLVELESRLRNCELTCVEIIDKDKKQPSSKKPKVVKEQEKAKKDILEEIGIKEPNI